MMSTKLMKTLMVAAVAASITPAEAKDTVVGLSPFGTPEVKLAEIKAVSNHLMETLKPGETGWVVDAYNQVQIAQITISTDPRKSKTLQRRLRNAPAFFANMKAFADASEVPLGEPFDGQIDFPGFMRNVGSNYPAKSSRDLILYAASPLNHDPRSPALSMKDGAIPDDASIAASRAENVYGAVGEANLLDYYTLHWGTNGAGWSLNDRHAHNLRRFVALSAAARGGVLATFAPEPEAALRNARSGISDPVGAYDFKPGDQPTMVTYQRVETALDIDAPGSIYQRALSERVAGVDELRQARNVEIAIRWTCDCDFDLAIKPAGAEPISFRNPQTPLGTLFKDFTSSADLDLGWETVSLPALDLTSAVVAINLYRGRPGTEVELRIAIGKETWGRSFVIQGGANGGAGFETTMQTGTPATTAWITVDPRFVTGGV